MTLLFRDAHEAFSSGDFYKARELYEAAGKVFGEDTVKYNLYLCDKKLKEISEGKTNIGNGGVPTRYRAFKSKSVEIPKELKNYYNPPKSFPKGLALPEIKGLKNDYSHLEEHLQASNDVAVSIVVLTYNRTEPLKRTLAGILNQNYPKENIEVIVVDDGGKDNAIDVVREFSNKLDVKYVWHRDIGFTPAAARNNGVNVARNNFIILLDVDMYPSRELVNEYVKYSPVIDKTVLIGPRRYIDLNDVNSQFLIENSSYAEECDDVVTNNKVAGKISGTKSVDWRLEIFEKTDMLRNEKVPFRVFASGNVAFSRTQFLKVGKFDERFNSWGFEDTELAFRFFNAGLYMVPVLPALALHQEPLGGENETDRELGKQKSKTHFAEVCPYYRHLVDKKDNWEVPKVSIYIPAYNAENTILDAVESVLNQTFKDVEACICDDGSTDGTIALLEKYYKNNSRVRWVSQKNGGIGAASNTAVNLCRGIYIGQLDSDDYLAEDVVEKCVAEMDKDLGVGLVYTTYENEYDDGRIEQGYNYPVYLREKLVTAMIAHHFRMFRKLYWCRTEGFNERIKNAVDYDMYLKLSEVCNAKHLNIVGYRRRLHGNNTSIRNFSEQMKNTAIVVNDSLTRMGLDVKCSLEKHDGSALIFNEVKSD
ncbi:glycosyltransferase [Alteromonas genovensis]|uniref:Glycosyltransferase n=1 Tax=Alteromonas genovensis TaxID=471225 RepID=A0A6N9TG03_9ALTE|nr:glycosyltransferase [Alteromonas genovensis]NDW16233.1 glycosyltransferase [Alteromonas genovensis]